MKDIGGINTIGGVQEPTIKFEDVKHPMSQNKGRFTITSITRRLTWGADLLFKYKRWFRVQIGLVGYAGNKGNTGLGYHTSDVGHA